MSEEIRRNASGRPLTEEELRAGIICESIDGKYYSSEVRIFGDHLKTADLSKTTRYRKIADVS